MSCKRKQAITVPFISGAILDPEDASPEDAFPVFFVSIFHVSNPLHSLDLDLRDNRQIVLIQPILSKTVLHPIVHYVPIELASRHCMLSKSEAFKVLSQLHNSGFLKKDILPNIIGKGFFYYNDVKVTVTKLTQMGAPKIICHQNESYMIE